jgi:hypothetical protein
LGEQKADAILPVAVGGLREEGSDHTFTLDWRTALDRCGRVSEYQLARGSVIPGQREVPCCL